jgi:hypothetical protein
VKVVQIDASEASGLVRSSLGAPRTAKRKTLAIASTVMGGVLFFIPFLLMQTPVAILIGVVVVGGFAIHFYQRDASELAELLLTVATLRPLAGPASYAQWTANDVKQSAHIAYYELSLADVLDRVDTFRTRSRGPSERQVPDRSWRRVVGFAITIVGTACVAAAPLYALLVLVSLRDLHGPAGGLVVGLGMAVLLFVGAKSIQLGRKMMQPSAKALLAKDTRSPVLWLRAFRDDRTVLRDSEEVNELEDRSLEENCTRELWYYGPVVAVGAPGDRLPPVGAVRGYFADDDWQNAVKHWMSGARFIIIVVGVTDWLRWEIETAMQGNHLSKLLFIFPPDTPSNRARRWRNTIAPLANEKYPELRDIDVTFARVGYFDGEDTFVLVNDRTKDHVTYEVALRLVVYGLCRAEAMS